MEWSRIKMLFIYLFALINIVLLLFYINIERKNDAQRYEESKAVIESMNKDNIEVIKPIMQREKLPAINVTAKDLAAIDKEVDKNSSNISSKTTNLQLRFTEPLTSIQKSGYKDDIYNFIKLLGKEEYVFASYDERSGVVKYNQQVDGLDIYDNPAAKMEFSVNIQGDVTTLNQTALKIMSKEDDKVIVTYSQAVQKLYHENLIGSNSKVNVDLGYYSYIPQVEEQVLTPVWKIKVTTLENEKIFYVDATTLKIIEN